jgi:hypothetical protein
MLLLWGHELRIDFSRPMGIQHCTEKKAIGRIV